MPLYKVQGTHIRFTVTDDNAEAFNRVDQLIRKRSLEESSMPLKEIEITVTLDELLRWKEVSAMLKSLRDLNGGFVNEFNGEIDDPRLVIV